MQIGDRVWRFDVNRRVYPKPTPGNVLPTGGPIFAEHFVPYEIMGEEKRSWLIGRPHTRPDKVGKHMIDIGPGGVWFSDLGREAGIWLADNRHPLSEAVRKCHDVDVLRQVAMLVGYEAKGAGDGE